MAAILPMISGNGKTILSGVYAGAKSGFIWGKEWIYVYLLLEFQSTVDPYMAVRLLSYVGLLYQDIIKTKQQLGNGKLPPVLPLVLYNGERAWNASRDIGSLIQHIPGGLEQYRPDFQYLLIDEIKILKMCTGLSEG